MMTAVVVDNRESAGSQLATERQTELRGADLAETDQPTKWGRRGIDQHTGRLLTVMIQGWVSVVHVIHR